jgi:hypothetical protein
MPSVIVTAVDTGTEQLTAAGHGLLTGNRLRLRNIGGALPASAPALAPVTDYFAIRVDADNIKVAVSSSDALAGTAVNITGAGTGTHRIEYGLPYCVPRIAANLTQVLPEDDNAAWNALVAIYDLLTGQTETVWSGAVSLAGALAAAGALSVGGALTVTGGATIGAPFARTGTITPTTISDSLQRNDFAPAGLATANTIRQVISGTATPTLGGLTGGVDGRIIVLHALGATAGDTLGLLHEEAASTAAHRFSLPGATTLTLPRNGAVTLQYDGTSSRWRVIGRNF